jgi:hypothetical protein
MTTAGALLNRVSRQLLSGTVEERNKLAASINDSVTSLQTTYELGGLRAGTVVEVDQELMYVWEATSGTKTLTVERGYMGTTAASHSSGAVVTQNPRFPRQSLFEALNQDIDDLSSPANGLYQVITTDVSYNGSDRQVNLTGAADVIDLIDVRVRYLADDYPVLRGVRLQRDLPTSDFASGYALVFDEDTIAGSLRVRYKKPFVRAASLASDIQSVCKIPETMEDILEMGVMARVMGPREIRRNFMEAQGDTRRAEEVPAGAILGSIGNILRMRRDRILAEKAKLTRQYPLTLRV